MARCRCSGEACVCSLVNGINTTVRGSGAPSNPWQVDVDPMVTGAIEFTDSTSVDFTVDGAGTVVNPLTVTAEAIIGALIEALDSGDITVTTTGAGTEADPLQFQFDVTCIDCTAEGTPGDALVLQVDGTYLPQPISVEAGVVWTSGNGLQGDGTLGNPITLDLCTYGDLRIICETS